MLRGLDKRISQKQTFLFTFADPLVVRETGGSKNLRNLKYLNKAGLVFVYKQILKTNNHTRECSKYLILYSKTVIESCFLLLFMLSLAIQYKLTHHRNKIISS
jgi:hypothetical protein